MKENIYIIYDKAANIGMKPLLIQRNDVVPVRELQQLANKPGTIIHQHAKDFELIHIGTVDLEELVIEQTEPRLVAKALDLQDKTA